MAEILDTPVEVVERANPIALPTVRGEVEFDKVTLTYGRGGPVIERISFHVEPGESLAIVGASGSGKSTIADVLVRLLDPDSGVVRLDGHDLKDLRFADLRKHVHVVEQEPLLFHTSIDANVRYANPEASDADVSRALEAAGIGRFLTDLPDGVKTVVGDRGVALSAGERQRIALARALVANPSVLILDEPSAALDPASERQVIDGYRQAMQGRTTIVISHKLDVVRTADHVVMIDGARIVERGTPAEISAAGGPFARLFGT